MGIPFNSDKAGWLKAFYSREEEFHQRIVTLAPAETQSLEMVHSEEDNPLLAELRRQSTRTLKPAEMLVLDDVLVDETRNQLVLPFMPEYRDLNAQVEATIDAPCNSALCDWCAYGHFLMDQTSREGLYETHPISTGLPMVFNLFNDAALISLLENQWKLPHHRIRHRMTRIHKLHLLIHRHHEVNRLQTGFMHRYFGPGVWAGAKSRLTGKRRIFLTRTRSRRLINESEIRCLVEKFGFEQWDDRQLIAMPLHEQAALFHSASAIVSTHGSNLTNTFFCRPDARVIELFKFTWIEQSPLCILRAAAPDARYAPLVDWVPWETWNQTLIGADIRIKPDKLENLLKQFC